VSLPSLSSVTGAARDDVRAAIGQAAERTGVGFSYLLAQAQSESGLNPTAKAGNSSATGLFQFLDQSWLGIVKAHGAEHGFGWAADAIQARRGGGFTVDPAMRQAVFALREQAGPAALMAAAYASDNAAGLTQALGRQVTGTDLYFAHFLGLAGAQRFLQAAGSNPGADAAALFPREARANRSIFYASNGDARSLAEVYALMGRKLDKAGAASGIGNPEPGSLVPSLPPSGSVGDIQLATSTIPGPDGTTNGIPDVSAMMAALEQGHMNVLKPNPAQARLAYLMLSLPVATG
jgi:hypothetical protein